MHTVKYALILPFLLAAGAVSAEAGTCTALFVTSSGLSFGASYLPSVGTPLTLPLAITVSCSGSGTLPFFALGVTAGDSGTYSSREMLGTTTPLDYQLYTDASYSTILGDGESGTGLLTGGSGAVSTQTLTAYGYVPPGQWVQAGSYSDSILVVVSF